MTLQLAASSASTGRRAARWAAPRCCSSATSRRSGWPSTPSRIRRHTGASRPTPVADLAAQPDRFDAERAEAHYRQALALAESAAMRPLVAHCHLGLGRVFRRNGKEEQAQEHLSAATMYREMGMTAALS
jgi:CubicO group peptidase (beta-lactamase class C family)